MLEATAAKPGNVHPRASFSDLSYADFVEAARAVAPVMGQAQQLGVGGTVLRAMQSTRAVCGSNPNLGIVLLIAPLAAVPESVPLRDGIDNVLQRLTLDDARFVYQAIRLAQPGGLGNVDEQDVSAEPDVTLLQAMHLAADRDCVAAQYTGGFSLVLETGMPSLAAVENFCGHWEEAVIRLHLELMSQHPDTLIARKRGRDEAEASAAKARKVLDAGWPDTPGGRDELLRLDHWLRAEGNARNPGTTADLVTASLFAALREGVIRAPAAEAILEHGRQTGRDR